MKMDGQIEQDRRSQAKNPCSRVVHIVLAVVYFVLLLLAIISFGSFAKEHNDIRPAVDRNGSGHNCILYTSQYESEYVRLRSGRSCGFVIWGEATVAFIALILLGVAVGKAIFGVEAVNVGALIESPTLGLSLLLGFAVSMTISIGLAVTCNAFKESIKARGEHAPDSCRHIALNVTYASGSEHHFYYYSAIHRAEVTAWIGTSVLLILTVLYSIIAVVYCVRVRQRRRGAVPYNIMQSASPQEKHLLAVAKDDVSKT